MANHFPRRYREAFALDLVSLACCGNLLPHSTVIDLGVLPRCVFRGTIIGSGPQCEPAEKQAREIPQYAHWHSLCTVHRAAAAFGHSSRELLLGDDAPKRTH